MVANNDALIFPSAPENTATYGVHPGYQWIIEVGNGTTNAFVTTLALSTPQVQYTQAEFPQLPWPTLTVPASSASITLTCQFITPTPTSDPCPGTAPATFAIY